MHDLGDAPQNHKLAILLKIAGIASTQPPVRQGFGGRFGFVEIAIEHTFRAQEDFTVLVNLRLDTRHGLADGMQAHLVGGLHRGDRAVLGLAVELAQLDPEGAVEHEGIFANRLATGKRIPQAAHAELILDRTENESLPQKTAQWFQRTTTLAVQFARLGGNRPVHEEVVEPLLQRG